LFEDLALIARDDLNGEMNTSFELARQRVDAKDHQHQGTENQPNHPFPHGRLLLSPYRFRSGRYYSWRVGNFFDLTTGNY